jgi:phenylacetate-CoA ligase
MQNYRFIPKLSEEELHDRQVEGLQWTVNHVWKNSPFYRQRFQEAQIEPGDVKDLDELRRLPFTTAEDLKAGYPLPLLSVPEDRVVRIHASSGTTGKRKVLAYTQRDIDTWKDMFARCYELSGMTTLDRVQVCVGYGLWTAGVGFQLGCERFGAMAVPVGPGLLDIQLQLLTDLKPTVLGATASMAFLLGEEVQKAGLQDKIALKKCIFGAETHSPKMRRKFEEALGLEDSFDVIGMTELYGPGAGLDCMAHEGTHYWADLYIIEIVDPETLEPVPDGQPGEMVVTSLCKEAAPLIRYRTRDMTRILPGTCSCGLGLPRIDVITGRSDDMIIFRGVNIYPGQLAELLEDMPQLSSEYQVQLTRSGGLDFMTLRVERAPQSDESADESAARELVDRIKRRVLVTSQVEIVPAGSLPRTFAKTKRVIDDRNQK